MSQTSEKISAVKGMNDLLPAQTALWEAVEDIIRSWMRSYGYENIRTPIVEHTPLFVRGLGQVTDIVEKEMYAFTDSLNGDPLCLRPENTAGVIRAAIEHSLTYDGPKRLWYMGPMFRHERPQKGRYRQFHQTGAEALGWSGPDIDAEIISMGQRLWDDLGIPKVRLELNSIGDAPERQAHRSALTEYFERYKNDLDEDSRRRLGTNPMRILDSKNPAMQAMIQAAPKPVDFLGPETRAHFEGLQILLKELNIPFELNPRLVRGLDYYNRTVFEWTTDLLGAQGTICGGGRYDPLAQMYGAKPTPAVGFAIGMERLIELVKVGGSLVPERERDVYIVHSGTAAERVAMRCAEELRGKGFTVVLHCGGGSFKSQFKKADASGARFAIVLGEDELARQEAAIKPLRQQACAAEPALSGQINVPLEALAVRLAQLMLA